MLARRCHLCAGARVAVDVDAIVAPRRCGLLAVGHAQRPRPRRVWTLAARGFGSRRRAAQVVIDKDKKDAAVVKEKVLVQEASATEISERAGAIAADAQADLDKALPALAAAVQCLKELKKAHIDEVKALKKPPGGVRLTLEVACVFFEARRAAYCVSSGSKRASCFSSDACSASYSLICSASSSRLCGRFVSVAWHEAMWS